MDRRLFRIIQGTNEAIETINPDGRDGGIDIEDLVWRARQITNKKTVAAG